MWNRIKYLLSYFVLIWAYFLVQKPVFMACNASKDYSIGDYLSVMWHGAGLDATTTGYLTILPFVLTVASVWFRHMPFRKIMTPYYIVVMLLISVIFVSDLSLFAFWESKLDASVFIYIDSPKNAMASVSGAYIAARVALMLGLTALMSGLLWLVTPRNLTKINMIGQQLLTTLCALPVGALLFLVIRGGIRVSTANVGDAYFSTDQYLNLSAINPAFNLFASTERQARYEDEFNFYDEERRATLMKGLYPKSDEGTEYVLNTSRPNILVIFMESFGATMIERLGGEKGVAPNLERLADEGVFFSRIFANSFRTDRGTVCTFSGYPGLPTLSLMKVSNLCQSLPNIARTLGDAGYTTDFLYGGDINFTNMQGYLRAGGFHTITSQDDFSMSDRNYSKWGVPDGLTFNRLFDMLKEREGAKKPWFTAFLTLSSHEPFEVPFKKFDDAHYNAFAYTDHCIGEFIKRFKKTPQWKNTLIVLLPDHGTPYPKDGERFSPRYFRIPMIWAGGAVSRKMTVEKIMNQTDLAATLLAQLGLKHGDFKFSRNVLSESYNSPFAFYSFVNGFCFLDNTGVSVYDNVSNKVFFNVAPEGDSLRVEKGKAILQTLYDEVGAMNSRRYK
ncbi:MAG: LTA synthase family protein [Prevotellaceae bacterium]|nr:LTA synthase family protein [Prevotellaceae bacterium]MDD7420468.1 LTA synthase family protein [Prevotellaceae bacterium]